MDPNLFNVIFTGRLMDGFEADAVIKAFASKFKIPEAKATKIINANKEVVLKPRTEHVKAYKFKSALEAIGMEVKLQRAAMAAPEPAVKKDPEGMSQNSKTEASVDSDKSPKETQIKSTQPVGNGSWSLEPIEKESTEEEQSKPAQIETVHPAYQREPQADNEILIKPTEVQTADKSSRLKPSVVWLLVDWACCSSL